jgi:hypothetical protein
MVARFILIKYTNKRKKCQITTKLPNGHKIYVPNSHNILEIAMKCHNILHCKARQNLPKIEKIWDENAPSGNPAAHPRAFS